jgi:hypothetical protein
MSGARNPQAVLEAIRERLIAAAEGDLAATDPYRCSKRQGERSSAPIIARRGLAAIQAAALLDQVIRKAAEPRWAHLEAAPRRAMTNAPG